MNRSLGERVHVSNLKPNETYRLRSRSGEGIVETLEDQGVDGWLVKIKQGQFSVLEKRYKSGDEFLVPVTWDGWFIPRA